MGIMIGFLLFHDKGKCILAGNNFKEFDADDWANREIKIPPGPEPPKKRSTIQYL